MKSTFFETDNIICMVHKGMYMEMGSPILHYMDMRPIYM